VQGSLFSAIAQGRLCIECTHAYSDIGKGIPIPDFFIKTLENDEIRLLHFSPFNNRENTPSRQFLKEYFYPTGKA